MKRLIILSLMLTGCTNASASTETLRKSGFSDIEITGYSWFACGDDDTFHTAFRAKNPKGEVVEGTVCCGIVKNCTVRF